jgi:hypothetical protein
MAKTRQTKENLQETFVTGLTGIFKIAGYKKTFFSYWFSIVPIAISLIGVAVVPIFKLDPLKFVLEIKTIMIDFLPGILGFTIAGFALMVGFIQAGMLDKITEPAKDSKFSLYQKMSSTFATNVILQAVALMIAYAVHFINYVDTNRGYTFNLSKTSVEVINYLGILVLTYWFSISLFLIIQIIVNIFGFSQLHHYFINKAKLDALDEEKDTNH